MVEDYGKGQPAVCGELFDGGEIVIHGNADSRPRPRLSPLPATMSGERTSPVLLQQSFWLRSPNGWLDQNLVPIETIRL
jgi:hypothetical protein